MLDRLELHSGPILHCSRRQHRLLQQAEQFLTASHQTASKHRKQPYHASRGSLSPANCHTHSTCLPHTNAPQKLNHWQMLAGSAAAAMAAQLPPPFPTGHSRPAQNRPNQQHSGYESAQDKPTQPNEQSTAHPTPHSHIPSMANIQTHQQPRTAVCLGRWERLEALHLCWTA